MITLATLASHSAQEVFDYAVTFLLTQNETSITPEDRDGAGDCRYRTANKDGKILKCGGGCFISDEEYSYRLENNSWTGLVNSERVPAAHSNLIRNFQAIHDGFPVREWKEGFMELAEREGLSSTAVEEFVD